MENPTIKHINTEVSYVYAFLDHLGSYRFSLVWNFQKWKKLHNIFAAFPNSHFLDLTRLPSRDPAKILDSVVIITLIQNTTIGIILKQ